MPTMWIIKDALEKGALGILLTLDTLIYGLITSVFKIFMALAGARLLTSEAYYDIANKVYAIIGVVMLFVLAYSVLRGIVNPDQAMKESGGGLVKRIIIAVIGLAITPVLFNVAYQGQALFLEHDVLTKIFFRGNSNQEVEVGTAQVGENGQTVGGGTANVDEQIKSIGGAVTATNLWKAFFYPAEDSNKEAKDIEADLGGFFQNGGGLFLACAGAAIAGLIAGGPIGVLLGGVAVYSCVRGANALVSGAALGNNGTITLEEAYAAVAGGENFSIFSAFIDNIVEDGDITYVFIISSVAGFFALYAFASFCFDMGIRAAKLAYFQIIAPIPLIMQVIPKYKDNFKNYISSVISTFAEVFIRISVVYIIVYIICHLGDLLGGAASVLSNENLNGIESTLAFALLILGLIAFARKAPEFISETLKLPKGSMSLGLRNKFAEGGGFALAATGMGAAQSAAYRFNDPNNKNKKPWRRALSAAAGFGSGFARGAYNQFKPGEDGKFGSNFAKGFKQAAENAEKTANEVQDAAKKNAERRAERTEAHEAYKNAIDTFKGGTAEEKEAAMKKAFEMSPIGRAVGGVKKWSTPTVDTSKMDAEAKIYGDIAGLKGKLEAKVDTDERVINAKNRVDDLSRQSVSDYAYDMAVHKKADELVKKEDGKIKNDILTTLRNTNPNKTYDENSAEFKQLYEKEKDSLHKKYYDEIRNTTSSPNYMSRANFVVDADSDEYREAEQILNRQRASAASDLKAAKKEAVIRKLAEVELTGLENDVSRELRQFFETNQKDFAEHSDIEINGEKLGDYLAKNFGKEVLSGKVDMSGFLKDLEGTNIEIVADTDKGSFTYKKNANGKYDKYDKDGNQVKNETFDNLDALKRELNNQKIRKSSIGKNDKFSSRISNTKDDATSADDKLRHSDEWITAHNNKRKQQEEKNKK